MSMVRADQQLAPQNGGQVPQIRVDTGSIGLMELCGSLAKSGYFKDTRDAAQALVKVLYGQEIGIPPVTAMMGIHIIEGKPAPSANLLASIVKRSPAYDYRVRVHTEVECAIEFFERSESLGISRWTIADAKRAKLSEKNIWVSYPRQMLFNRALSEGVRTFCPDLFGGAPVYTPEELGAEVDSSGEMRHSTPRQDVNTATGEVIDVSDRVTAAAERSNSYAGATMDQPSGEELSRAISAAGQSLKREWEKQELGDNAARGVYTRAVLGRAPATKDDPAGQLADARQVLADLQDRPKANRAAHAAYTKADGNTEDGAQMRKDMARILGRTVLSRKEYTAAELRRFADQCGNSAPETAPVEAPAGAPVLVEETPEDPFIDEE
jgi:hypothetical protein